MVVSICIGMVVLKTENVQLGNSYDIIAQGVKSELLENYYS